MMVKWIEGNVLEDDGHIHFFLVCMFVAVALQNRRQLHRIRSNRGERLVCTFQGALLLANYEA